MKEISDWLVKIENLANQIYHEGAQFFEKDSVFSKFLIKLANDEAEHYHIMSKASEYLESHPIQNYAIEVDPATKKRIEDPLIYSLEKINNRDFTKEEFSEIIIENEFSEWNDIFNYIIRSINMRNNSFSINIPDMEEHLEFIRDFFVNNDFGKEKINNILKSSSIEEERILVVEDEVIISDILKGMLRREGNVYVATNGKEALTLLKEKYFRFILSDIDMPVMDGIEFYNEAARFYKNISDRFVFFSGDVTDERLKFFKDEGVSYLKKPAGISKVLDKVLQIMYGIRKK